MNQEKKIRELRGTIKNALRSSRSPKTRFIGKSLIVKLVAAFFTILFAFAVHGSSTLVNLPQSTSKATVSVQLKKPDDSQVSGILTITGSDTTITDNAFLSPKSYILKNITGIDRLFGADGTVTILPNPSRDGFASLEFDPFNDTGSRLILYDSGGKKLGTAEINEGNTITTNAAPGILLFRVERGNRSQSGKIVTVTSGLTIIMTANGSRQKSAPASSISSSDEYALSFSDPSGNVEAYGENFTVLPGNTLSIDKILQWTQKNIKYSANTNKGTTLRVKNIEDAQIIDEETTSTGTIPTQTLLQRFDNTKGMNLEYALTAEYTDPATFTRTQFKDETFLIDTLRNGHFYVTITGNGSTYVVKRNGTTLATAAVGQQSLFKVQGDQTNVDLEVSGANLVTKTVPVTLNKGLFSQAITLDPASYSHALNGSLLSSISGKTIKDGTRVYIIKDFATTPTDTTWVTSSGAAFSYSWNDNKATLSTRIGTKNAPGHQDNATTFTMDNQETRNLTLTGIIYSLTQPINVKNQYAENVASASITGGDAAVTTNASGLATVTKNNLQTDINNLPLVNYILNLIISKSNIQTLNTTTTSIAGANSQVQKDVTQLYTFWLTGTVTPNGASVLGTEPGDANLTATVLNGTYETNHITKTVRTYTLDQVLISATNYTSQTFTNITMNEGANTRNATLTPITVNYTHNLNGSLLSSIAGKTIKDGTRVYIIKDFATTPTDTAWVTSSGAAFSYSWTDTKQTLSTRIGTKNAPGHQDNATTFTMDDQETRNLTLTGIIYSLTKPVRLQNQYSEPVASASITGGDAAVTTNTEGRANITKNNLTTDANNLPLTNYVLALTISKSNIQTSNQNVNATAGTNPESLLSVVQEYEHWLHGTNTSPDGSLVQIWRGGTAVQSGTVSGGDYQTNHIKRTTKTFVADSVTVTRANYIRFSQPNFTLTDGGNNLEATLSPVPVATVHDFYITVKDIHGDLVRDLTQQIEFNGDGAIMFVTPDANGRIHIQRTETSNPSTKLKVSNTSQKYSDFQVYRKQNHSLADTNYCQVQRWDGTPQFAELTLTGIPSELVQYVAKEKVKTPEPVVATYGDSISISHPVILEMMGGRLGGATTKYISRAGAEQVYVFQMTFNESTGVPVEQAQLDRAKGELDKILAIYTQNDGNKLLNSTFYRINSYSDPIFVQSQARDNHDNMAYTTFDNSSPYNGVNLTLTYSSNNKPRIKNSDSRYNTGTNTGIIFEEIYQQFTNNKDSPSGGTGGWVTTVSGDVTDFAKTFSRIIYLFNQGTPTQ